MVVKDEYAFQKWNRSARVPMLKLTLELEIVTEITTKGRVYSRIIT